MFELKNINIYIFLKKQINETIYELIQDIHPAVLRKMHYSI